MNHLEDGVEARIALSRKSPVKALPRHTGVAGNLGHALGSCDVTQGLGDKSSIAIGLLQTRLQVGGHFLGRSEMAGHVVPRGDGLADAFTP